MTDWPITTFFVSLCLFLLTIRAIAIDRKRYAKDNRIIFTFVAFIVIGSGLSLDKKRAEQRLEIKEKTQDVSEKKLINDNKEINLAKHRKAPELFANIFSEHIIGRNIIPSIHGMEKDFGSSLMNEP